MMQRYALFAGDQYYPRGGWGDFVGTFGTVEEATKEAENHERRNGSDWHHIIDLTTGENVTQLQSGLPPLSQWPSSRKRFSADYLTPPDA